MKDRDFEIKLQSRDAASPSAEEKPAAEDSPRDEAEAKKLAAELDELRQSLLRHQADFANYRKRAEKENREAGQRATARIIEALIPVVDGFEHALAAHREAEYDNYRKGFELIYKPAPENRTRLVSSASIRSASLLIRICTKLSIARKPASIPMASSWRRFSRATSFMAAYFGPPWCA